MRNRMFVWPPSDVRARGDGNQYGPMRRPCVIVVRELLLSCRLTPVDPHSLESVYETLASR